MLPGLIRKHEVSSPVQETIAAIITPRNVLGLRTTHNVADVADVADRQAPSSVPNMEDVSDPHRPKHTTAFYNQYRLANSPAIIKRVVIHNFSDPVAPDVITRLRQIRHTDQGPVKPYDFDVRADRLVGKVKMKYERDGRGNGIGRGRGGIRRNFGSGSLNDTQRHEEEMDCLASELLRGPISDSEDEPAEYEPAEFSKETLRGNGPAIASGLWGMSEIVEEQLTRMEEWRARIERRRNIIAEQVEIWVKKMLAGEHEQCPPSGWKAAMRRAEQLRAATFASASTSFASSTSSSENTADNSNNNTRGDEGIEQPHVFTEEQKDALVGKLVGGNYELMGVRRGSEISSEKNSFIAQVLLQHVARNGTYLPEDGQSLIRKTVMMVQLPTN